MNFFYAFPILVLFLYDPGHAEPPVGPLTAFLALTAAQLVLVAAVRVVAVRRARQLGRLDVLGQFPELLARVRGLKRFQGGLTALLFLFLVAYFLEVHVFHLPRLDPYRPSLVGDVLLLLPFFALVLLARWAAFPAVRFLRGLPCEVGEYLRFQVRAMLVFTLPSLGYVLAFRALVRHVPAVTAALEEHPGLLLVGAAAIVVLLLSAAPVLVRHLFPRVPVADLPDAPRWSRLQARLAAIAAASGARLGPILVWNTGGLRVANAAVAGLFTRFQRIFVSDVLLERLSDDELVAVLAHEMGHQRLKHPLLNVLLALSAIALVTLALLLAVPALEGSPEGPLRLAFPLAVIAFNAAYIFTILRFALNRFERQADAAAAEAMGGTAPFVEALTRVLELNVAPADQGSVTHPSASRRLRSLAALSDGETRRRWLRGERRLNAGLALVAAALLALATAMLERL